MTTLKQLAEARERATITSGSPEQLKGFNEFVEVAYKADFAKLSQQWDAIINSLKEIEKRTRPYGDVADQKVNELVIRIFEEIGHE